MKILTGDISTLNRKLYSTQQDARFRAITMNTKLKENPRVERKAWSPTSKFTFMFYDLEEDKVISSILLFSSFAFGFNFVSTDISVQKEDLVYPPVSFISELGGSLGLFVGFSFLNIWDWIDFLIARSKRFKDYIH